MLFSLPQLATSVRETARQFAEREIIPRAQAIDYQNESSTDLWPKLGKLGLLGITVDHIWGGTGLGYLEHVIVMEELSRASSSVGLSYGAHSNLCMNQIHLHGTTEQKQLYLSKLVRGELIGTSTTSEASTGSDVHADDRGDHYVLNGIKRGVINGSEAQVFIVYAQTNSQAGAKGITAFIVLGNFYGFSTIQKLNKLDIYGSNICEVVFKDCHVPKENILGEVDDGARILMYGLDFERVVFAGGPLGIMRACLNIALPYVREKEQHDQKNEGLKPIRAKIANMYTTVNAARAYVYAVAQACDQGKVTCQDAASVSLFATEQATQTALQTLQCIEGKDYSLESPAGQLLRDAKHYENGIRVSQIRSTLMERELSGYG